MSTNFSKKFNRELFQVLPNLVTKNNVLVSDDGAAINLTANITVTFKNNTGQTFSVKDETGTTLTHEVGQVLSYRRQGTAATTLAFDCTNHGTAYVGWRVICGAAGASAFASGAFPNTYIYERGFAVQRPTIAAGINTVCGASGTFLTDSIRNATLPTATGSLVAYTPTADIASGIASETGGTVTSQDEFTTLIYRRQITTTDGGYVAGFNPTDTTNWKVVNGLYTIPYKNGLPLTQNTAGIAPWGDDQSATVIEREGTITAISRAQNTLVLYEVTGSTINPNDESGNPQSHAAGEYRIYKKYSAGSAVFNPTTDANWRLLGTGANAGYITVAGILGGFQCLQPFLGDGTPRDDFFPKETIANTVTIQFLIWFTKNNENALSVGQASSYTGDGVVIFGASTVVQVPAGTPIHRNLIFKNAFVLNGSTGSVQMNLRDCLIVGNSSLGYAMITGRSSPILSKFIKCTLADCLIRHHESNEFTDCILVGVTEDYVGTINPSSLRFIRCAVRSFTELDSILTSASYNNSDSAFFTGTTGLINLTPLFNNEPHKDFTLTYDAESPHIRLNNTQSFNIANAKLGIPVYHTTYANGNEVDTWDPSIDVNGDSDVFMLILPIPMQIEQINYVGLEELECSITNDESDLDGSTGEFTGIDISYNAPTDKEQKTGRVGIYAKITIDTSVYSGGVTTDGFQDGYVFLGVGLDEPIFCEMDFADPNAPIIIGTKHLNSTGGVGNIDGNGVHTGGLYPLWRLGNVISIEYKLYSPPTGDTLLVKGLTAQAYQNQINYSALLDATGKLAGTTIGGTISAAALSNYRASGGGEVNEYSISPNTTGLTVPYGFRNDIQIKGTIQATIEDITDTSKANVEREFTLDI